MLLIATCIHRTKRQATASEAKDDAEGDGLVKKVKLNSKKKKAPGFGNFDNW